MKKLKPIRAQFRGVRNVEFFLFRLCQIYAYSPTYSHDSWVAWNVIKRFDNIIMSSSGLIFFDQLFQEVWK